MQLLLALLPSVPAEIPAGFGQELQWWPAGRTPAGHRVKRAEWCNTALLIYREKNGAHKLSISVLACMPYDAISTE